MKTIGLVKKNSPDYVEKFFDHLTRGVVVVPLRSRDDQYRIQACGVAEIVEPEDGHGWIESKIDFPSSDRLAQIAFTSGTEGDPKGVLLTAANLATTVERIKSKMRIDETISEYIGVPVYHSFGFGRCRVVASVGGRAYIPADGFNPREIAKMLAAAEINAISAVPSLWRIVLKNKALFAGIGGDVRWIEIGSQPMSAAEKREMRALFPHARIVQHYGLTEASRSTFLDVGAASDAALESVGEPNGDVEISISGSGRIRIRGSHVAQTLLINGKHVRNTDDEGWLTTNDLGELRDGSLFFLGRVDDVINSGGIKIAPDRLEAVLKASLGLADGIAVAKVPDAARGDGVLVAAREDVEHGDTIILDRAADALADLGIKVGSSLHLMRVSELPVTDSGKVKRRALSAIFQSRPADAPTRGHDGTRAFKQIKALIGRVLPQQPRTVRALYERVFPTQSITGQDTFLSLGGDSLSFVEVSVALEELLGQLPQNWQNTAIRELEQLGRKESLLHPVDTSLLLRFIGIIAIVTGHFTLYPVGGATFLLLAVAGFNFARFQLPTVLLSESVTPILLTASRLAVPLLLMIAALQFRLRQLSVDELLLVNNWAPASEQVLDFWFIEMMVQLLLILAALMAVPAVRRLARARPQLFVYGSLGLTVAAATLAPLIWDTTPQFDRIPHMLAWLFVLGWALHLATTTHLKLIVSALVIALPLLVWGADEVAFWIAHGQRWVWIGCLTLLLIDKVRVPFPLNKLAYWIGGASMMIYIVHWQAYNTWHRLRPIDNALVDITVAIASGVVCWWGWNLLTRHIAKLFARKRALTRPTGVTSVDEPL